MSSPGAPRLLRAVGVVGLLQDREDGLRVGRTQAASLPRQVDGGAGQSAVRRPDLGLGRELRQVLGHRTGIADGLGAAEHSPAQGVVEGRAEQRPQHPTRLVDAGILEQPGGLGDEGAQVVRAEGEGRVVERTVLLLDEDRLAAHLQHERLAEGFQVLERRDGEAGVAEPVEVDRGAGEGHGRMYGQRQDADELGGFEDADAVAAAGVDDDLTGPERADLGQAAHQAGQRLVGNGEQDEVDALMTTWARQGSVRPGAVRGARPRLLADRRDRGHLVAGAMQGGTQDGTDPARADDAHGEPRRVVLARRAVECAHDGRTYPGRMGG